MGRIKRIREEEELGEEGSSWIPFKSRLEIMVTVNNHNPLIFPWEKRVSENYAFLSIFQKVWFDSQN